MGMNYLQEKLLTKACKMNPALTLFEEVDVPLVVDFSGPSSRCLFGGGELCSAAVSVALDIYTHQKETKQLNISTRWISPKCPTSADYFYLKTKELSACKPWEFAEKRMNFSDKDSQFPRWRRRQDNLDTWDNGEVN